MRLPIWADGGATCFTCPAPCCTSYVVPILGFDLWRLARGLQLPWSEVAEARADRMTWESFALDGGETRLGFYLRQREAETCRFLLTLPSGQRCGAHAWRPLACRVYPWTTTENSQLGVEIAGHAMCPAPQRAHFEQQVRVARAGIFEELSERPLYQLAVVRWNDHVARSGRRFTADEFAGWVLRLYDAMVAERGKADWQLTAPGFVSGFPLG
jgi:hypothetical protein